MTLKVLVVDDSSFFRHRVTEIINADPRLEVIDCAVNGKEAIEKTARLKPDVITMDVEMPVMDGITAVRQIMQTNPTPILMFSSLTHQGAKATLDALDAGALDFLPKKFEDIARNREEAIKLLQQRVSEIARKRVFMRRTPSVLQKTDVSSIRRQVVTDPSDISSFISARPVPNNIAVTSQKISSVPMAPLSSLRFKASGKRYQLMAIATSTGGPVALQKILTCLPANFPCPILLIQHMPAAFTAAFAERLNGLCQIRVKEAQDGEVLKSGIAYLAPGGFQMMLEGRPACARVKIMDAGERINYKPCVDITFGSIAKIYGDKVLSMVLTGMGADGREGARILKEEGSTVWAQDEETCVVYGMPQAVAKAGISTLDLPLDRIAECILLELNLI